ncbi:unnamed protein product [Discosporangium mesarthrocarpum]
MWSPQVISRIGMLIAVMSKTGAAPVTRVLEVTHSFGLTEQFQDRGFMELHNDLSSPKATLPNQELTANDLSRFHDLLIADGLYQIKLSSNDGQYTSEIFTAVPACDLRLAGFREEITLHVDPQGAVIGLDYKAPVGPLASTKDCKKLKMPESMHIHSSVKVVRAAEAQGIPVQVTAPTPPPGLGHLKEKTEHNPGQGSQSMLVKYWYIFLPLALTWMFSTAPPPPAGGGGGGGSGG